jgi:hypothetical protein
VLWWFRTLDWKDLIKENERGDVEELIREFPEKFGPARAKELSLAASPGQKLYPPSGQLGQHAPIGMVIG